MSIHCYRYKIKAKGSSEIRGSFESLDEAVVWVRKSNYKSSWGPVYMIYDPELDIKIYVDS